MNSILRAIAAAGLVASGWAAGPVMAQESFFKDKVVHLIIPAGRAGGIRASNYVANNAATDGTTIYLIHESAITHQLLFPDQVMYDAPRIQVASA